MILKSGVFLNGRTSLETLMRKQRRLCFIIRIREGGIYIALLWLSEGKGILKVMSLFHIFGCEKQHCILLE